MKRGFKMKILFRLQLTHEEYEQLFYIVCKLKEMKIPCLLKEILIEYFNQEEFTTEDYIIFKKLLLLIPNSERATIDEIQNYIFTALIEE